MPHYMLDTDICSFIVKRYNERVLKRLRATSVAEVCISVVTKAVLLYGVDVSLNRPWTRPPLQHFFAILRFSTFQRRRRNITPAAAAILNDVG